MDERIGRGEEGVTGGAQRRTGGEGGKARGRRAGSERERGREGGKSRPHSYF